MEQEDLPTGHPTHVQKIHTAGRPCLRREDTVFKQVSILRNGRLLPPERDGSGCVFRLHLWVTSLSSLPQGICIQDSAVMANLHCHLHGVWNDLRALLLDTL